MTRLTTESGAPVTDNQNSQSAGANGPLLLQDQYLIEKLARFNRERIPERVVHAVGSGAHGVFEVTNRDLARYTRMKMMSEVGKTTEMFARFSTVAGSKGAPDAVRDPRGFALKFYTEDGNWDLTGNNTPVFFIRDTIKFPDFIHSQKYDPFSNAQEADNVWDFFSLSPEATHQFTILFSDRGIPATYRNMNGYGSHTFQWVNAEGVRHWVKFHFKTDQGIKTLTSEESAAVVSDAEHHQKDLYTAIESGDFPSWTVQVQLMPEADAETYRINPFDVTKVWPHADYPPMQIGKMTLNRVPDNYFVETEQSAFDPGHMVAGVGPSPDKMLQGRLFAYGDAHRYRLGINHTRIEINTPKGVEGGSANYGRDGFMATGANGGRSVNYEPNSFGGPTESNDEIYNGMETGGLSGHYDNMPRQCDDFEQAGALYRLQPVDAQERLVKNIAASLLGVSKQEIVDRSISNFRNADAEFGAGIEKAMADLRGTDPEDGTYS